MKKGIHPEYRDVVFKDVSSDFEIITVDVVARPSAQNAYPKAVYEAMMHSRRGAVIDDLSRAMTHDPKAQEYLARELLNAINNLKS